MANSLAQTADLNCPHCRYTASYEIWLTIDTDERPDLVDQVRTGTLHQLTCPQCGEQTRVDAALLVYRPMQTPHVIFSPAEQTSQEQDREQAGGLLARLTAELGDAWREAWLEEVVTVPRALLAAMLSDDPETALKQAATEMEAAVERMRTENPAAYRELEETARQAQAAAREAEPAPAPESEMPPALRDLLDELAAEGVRVNSQEELDCLLDDRPELGDRFAAAMRQAAPPLVQALDAFISGESWTESQQIVEQHPELLSDDADALLAQVIAAAEADGNGDAIAFYTEHRELLRRCLEAGVARAFAEKTLPAAALAEAARLGLTPEEFAVRLRAAQAVPPELQRLLDGLSPAHRDALLEILAGVNSNAEFLAALATHPELNAALEALRPAPAHNDPPDDV